MSDKKTEDNNVLEHLKECCIETTLHGPKYLIKNNGSFIIFLFWFCICVTAFVFCVILLWLQWDVYQSQPTLTSIENTNKPIYEVRFPAVTICNNNQIYLPRTINITSRLLEQGFQNEEIQEFYKYLSYLITFDSLPDNNFTDITNAIQKMGYDISRFMFELSQPCENLVERCEWFYGECKSRIKKIKTQNGYCCSLNYHLPESYSGGEPLNDTEEQLLQVGSAGSMVELSFVIDVEPNKYMSSLQPFYGVEVLIHDGFAYPEVSIIPTIAEINTEVKALIGVQTIATESHVESVAIPLRRCLFDGEEIINTPFEYSFESCVSECRVLRMISLCQCVPFYYQYNGEVRFCDFKDIPCLSRYKVVFYSTYNPQLQKNEEGNIDEIGLDLDKCLCYPECDDITYDVQSQAFNFLPNASFYGSPIRDDESINLTNKIVLSVTYRHLTLIQYRRDVRMTWNNLLASLGGIFGLCVGGSVISIAEFFYLFVLYFMKRRSQYESKNSKETYQFKIHPLPKRRKQPIINYFVNVNEYQQPVRYGFHNFE